jgi:hypothetical protein
MHSPGNKKKDICHVLWLQSIHNLVKKLIYALKWRKTLTIVTRRSKLLLETDEQEWERGKKTCTSFPIIRESNKGTI